MEITPIFVAVLIFMLIFHSARISIARAKVGVSIGNGKDEDLIRRIRIQGNFIEYMPLALLLMWMMEYHLISPTALWIYGCSIVLGRILHAWGLWSKQTPMLARLGGMVLTYGPLAIGSIALILAVY